jgi:hypothetical protein
MATKYFARKNLSLAQQDIRMRALHPQFKSRLSRSAIIWIGPITPMDVSRTYTIKVQYRLNKHPSVLVVDPPLRKRSEGEPILHIYKGGYLCLHRPKYLEWTPQDYIAETIIPWTALWLYFYEVWHATGEWLGGGEHPSSKTKRRKGKI